MCCIYVLQLYIIYFLLAYYIKKHTFSFVLRVYATRPEGVFLPGNEDPVNTLACWITCTLLDSCNTVFARREELESKSLIACSKHDLPSMSVVTVLPRRLRWLPVSQRIAYKMALKIVEARLNRQPAYLSNIMADYVRPTPSTSLLWIQKTYSSFIPKMSSKSTALGFWTDYQRSRS